MELEESSRDFIVEHYQKIKSIDNRVSGEIISQRDRNNFQRDYARILYSSSFRRLQGKMQILGIHHDQFFRNRLTHSLEVAQIARSIAGNLRRAMKGKADLYGKDMYIIEACSLSHDLGHPPFGHYGEHVLNNLDDEHSFEGNAQSVRILTTLEKKAPNKRGLNLTYRTLLGISKYIYNEDSDSSKFLYNNDYEKLIDFSRRKGIKLRTLDVQIIDIADEIAYAAHDLEDSLSLGLFTIDEFLHELDLWLDENDNKVYENFLEIVNACRDFAKKGTQLDSSEEYSFLFKKELTSKLVDKLINDITLAEVDDYKRKKTNTDHDYELGFKKYSTLSKALKKVTFKCINRSDIIHLYERKGKKIIEGLFTVYNDPDYNEDNKLLPPEYRLSEKFPESNQRLIIDYIAGMMDSFAESQYLKYYGENSLNSLY